jgi:phosphatidylglycerophosphatase C
MNLYHAQRQPDQQPAATRTSKVLALFDFDGTITNKDTFVEYISFFCTQKKWKYLNSLLYFPLWLCNRLGLISNQRTRRQLVRIYLKGTHINVISDIAAEFVKQKMPQLLNPKALEKIRWHQEQGHQVVIVTPTLGWWVRNWAYQHNITVIATELAVNEDGYCTGKLLNKYCTGAEKVRRIRATIRLVEYSYIYAYGDSSGDKAMLRLANESYYKKF